MLMKRKTFGILLTGLIICIFAGGGFFYVTERQEASKSYIPEVGLPNGKEFVELFQETSTYWQSKLNFSVQIPQGLFAKPDISSWVSLQDIEPSSGNHDHAPILHVQELQTITDSAPHKLAQDDQESTDGIIVKRKEPPKGVVISEPMSYRYDIEDEILRVEGVLVPQKMTVISSSRDGKIEHIYVDNGDVFQAGDILLTYDCQNLNDEIAAIEAAENLAKKRVKQGQELFKLDIISDLEQQELKVEEQKTTAQNSTLKSQMDACIIRASYDGRVTNRLANPQEYTRTDRVLMEIASRDQLDVQFILPSKWLRYVNIGAPLSVKVSETGEIYQAEITKIYGEVDPVSQSIQMSAALKGYNDPLLPGMSGLVEVNALKIRDQGILGYLETQKEQTALQMQNNRRLSKMKQAVQTGANDG